MKWSNFLTAVLTLCLVISTNITPAAQAETIQFSDISNHWAKEDILLAIQQGYVDGYPDGTFRPDSNVSRAEFMTLLVKALGMPKIMSVQDHWYEPYFETLKKSLVYREDDFPADEADEDISRQEMINIAYRAVHKELQVETVLMDNASLVYNAVKEGIIQGLAKGDLALDRTTTRAQAVVVIERLRKLQAGQKITEIDKHALSLAEIAVDGTNFRTIFNVEPVKLPLTIEYGYGLNVTIDQMFVADMSDEDDPFVSDISPIWLSNKMKVDGGYYVMIFKYHLEDYDPSQSTNWPFRFLDFGLNSGWTSAGSDYEKIEADQTESKYTTDRGFWMDRGPDESQKRGFGFAIQSKVALDKYLSSSGFERLIIFAGKSGKQYDLVVFSPKK